MGVNFHLQNFIWWWNFPSGPVVKGLHFQCQGHGFDPGQETKIPHTTWQKKKKKNFIWWCLQGQKDYNSLSYIPMKDIMKKTDCTIKILYESDFCNSISRISLQSDKPWVQRVYYAWSHILSFCVCVAKLCGMQQDPGSLTRNQTHSLCSGRAESQPLDPQGSPPLFPFLKDE